LVNINEYENSRISIYPNPSNGKLNIHDYENVSNIKIYNVLGETVYENHSVTKEFETNLKTGMYLVNIKAKNGDLNTQKLIIE
jgi:hypothetical protein